MCRNLNQRKTDGIIGLSFILFVSISIIIKKIPICFNQKAKLEDLIIQKSDLGEALHEMEIVYGFLISNAEQIMWIRGILLTVLIGIVGYTLKEYYLGDYKMIINEKRPRIMWLLISIVFLAFILESIIQVEQTLLINRISQLDKAINPLLFTCCKDKALYDQLPDDVPQKIFINKYKINPSINICSCDFYIMIYTILAPTFLIFYFSIIGFLGLFYVFIGKP